MTDNTILPQSNQQPQIFRLSMLIQLRKINLLTKPHETWTKYLIFTNSGDTSSSIGMKSLWHGGPESLCRKLVYSPNTAQSTISHTCTSTYTAEQEKNGDAKKCEGMLHAKIKQIFAKIDKIITTEWNILPSKSIKRREELKHYRIK